MLPAFINKRRENNRQTRVIREKKREENNNDNQWQQLQGTESRNRGKGNCWTKGLQNRWTIRPWTARSRTDKSLDSGTVGPLDLENVWTDEPMERIMVHLSSFFLVLLSLLFVPFIPRYWFSFLLSLVCLLTHFSGVQIH